MAPPENISTPGKRKRSVSPPNSEETRRRDGIVSTRWRRRADSDFASEIIRRMEEEAPMREAKRKAEETRRSELGQMGRLQEDGRKLQESIKADPKGMAWLELSRSLSAICRARDCLFVMEGPFQDPKDYDNPRNTIETDFRIRVNGAVDCYNRAGRRYYHYQCFEAMVDVPSLIPDKFQLDRSTFDNWGLLITEWYKHKCHINHEDFSAFVVEFCAYQGRCTKWVLEGEDRRWTDAPCKAPPQSYITSDETEPMSITDVLELAETSETRKVRLTGLEIDAKFSHELGKAASGGQGIFLSSSAFN